MKTTTTSGNHTEKEVKRTSVKRTVAAKDSSHGKSSITDKSKPKAKTTVHHTTVKHPVKDKATTTTGRTTTIHKEDMSPKTAAANAPVRRKRNRKSTETHSDIVLYEHTGVLLNGFTVLVGLFLLAEGIWGLQSTIVFNVLTTNTTHAIIHIVLGIIAVIVGAKQNAYGFSVFLGLLLAAVGVLRFIPSTADLVITYLNVNETVAALNIGIGLLALLLSFTDTKSYHTVSH